MSRLRPTSTTTRDSEKKEGRNARKGWKMDTMCNEGLSDSNMKRSKRPKSSHVEKMDWNRRRFQLHEAFRLEHRAGIMHANRMCSPEFAFQSKYGDSGDSGVAYRDDTELKKKKKKWNGMGLNPGGQEEGGCPYPHHIQTQIFSSDFIHYKTWFVWQIETKICSKRKSIMPE